jgi:hypothetical protein
LSAAVKETASYVATADCPYGSKRVEVGVDDDRDGQLDSPAEVDSSFTVCLGIDPEADGVDFATDNCRAVANPTQADADQDGVGDACDAELVTQSVVAPATPTTLTFTTWGSEENGVRVYGNIEMYDTATLDVVTPTGATPMMVQTQYGFIGPTVTTIPYYVFRTRDGSEIEWTSLRMADVGNWSNVSVTFRAFKDGVQIATEDHVGDIPYTGWPPASYVPYTFVNAAFRSADAVVIQSNPYTPIQVKDFVYLGGCLAGGVKYSWGLDNGDGGGTSGNGTLEAGELDGSRTVCNP